MKVSYDSEADALYIELHEAKVSGSEDVEEGVVVDFDEAGHVVGIEVLDASKRLLPEELSTITYEDLVSGSKANLIVPSVLSRYGGPSADTGARWAKRSP
jgi:uncharacterized protein YuzE